MRSYKRLTLLCGHYGSGKTNIAVNWTKKLHEELPMVLLADLDIVNPYYRAKDSARELEEKGIGITIASQMEANVLYLVGDVLKSFNGLGEGMTSQRLSAIMNQMATAGVLAKTTEKNKSYFSLV